MGGQRHWDLGHRWRPNEVAVIALAHRSGAQKPKSLNRQPAGQVLYCIRSQPLRVKRVIYAGPHHETKAT